MVTAEVGVDLVTKLKDKGFKDLEKSSKKQNALLAQLGKRLAAAFSVVAVVNFGKQSVKAFQDAQREANRLRTQLESLNLGFAQPFLTDFIQKTQLATGISGGVLTDAFNTLSQATNDVTTAQRLLAVSLDISAATGRDLSTVTVALQRGFAGQVSALSRLKIGFTSANLKGRDFDEVLAELESKFSGSSARAADTLAGKLARLNEAVDEAKEGFGEGLVKGLEQSNVAVDDLQRDIITLGNELGRLTGKATGFFATVNRDLLNFFETDTGVISTFVRSLVKSQGDLVRLEQERGRTALRVRNQILKAEAQISKETQKQTAAEKKAAAEKKRTADLERLRNSIAFKFDIEAINLQAALRRNLSTQDKARVLELAALKKADFETDEEALKTLQGAIAATSSIKPEINFKDNLEDIEKRLRALIESKYNINIGATISVPNIPAPGRTATVSLGVGDFRKSDESTARDLAVTSSPAPFTKPQGLNLPGEIGGEPIINPRGVPSTFDPAGLRIREEGVTVNVNVQGSVIAQNDLVAAVTDAVYATQRTGNPLLLSEI